MRSEIGMGRNFAIAVLDILAKTLLRCVNLFLFLCEFFSLSNSEGGEEGRQIGGKG